MRIENVEREQEPLLPDCPDATVHCVDRLTVSRHLHADGGWLVLDFWRGDKPTLRVHAHWSNALLPRADQAGAATGGEPGTVKASAAAPVETVAGDCAATCCTRCKHYHRETDECNAGQAAEFLCLWASTGHCDRHTPGYPCPEFTPKAKG